MFFNPDKSGDGVIEENDKRCDKCRTGDQRGSNGVVDISLVLFFLNEAEIGRFKTEKHQRIQKRDQRIYQRHLSVLGSAGKFKSEIGSEQVVEKPCEN